MEDELKNIPMATSFKKNTYNCSNLVIKWRLYVGKGRKIGTESGFYSRKEKDD